MPRKKTFAVIGIGNFGTAVIKTLISKKQDVYVYDKDKTTLTNTIDTFENLEGAAIDTTFKNNLIEHGFKEFDTVIVTMSSNIEAGILTIIGLQDIGVKNIIAKGKDDRHVKILNAIGITNIVQPDAFSGKMTATKAMYGLEADIQSMDDKYASIIIKVSEPSINGKNLTDIGLINNKMYNIIKVTRKGKTILPADLDKLEFDDEVLFISQIDQITKLINLLTIEK
ncbi:NAD-binding protein [Spiroplasma endosymbiont of Anurida maritima]|uniref:potassium channel family protein n=1 Tax=Spiroplasma endosymbiont of Anurida maritima TaxID=2967972 RepID=UPI0036D383EE